MDILQVALFGGVHVTNNNWVTEVTITRENQALLAYLLLQRQRVHSREVLAGIFWGEHSQEKARGSLNTALWKLKKALEPDGVAPGTYLKNTHSGEVGFNKESRYWLDVEVFEEEINLVLMRPFQTMEEAHIANLENTLEIYRGELLEGFYDNWALRERERLRALYLKSLMYLMHYYKFRRLYEKAIVYGQQILGLDPLREEIHRELMRLYLDNGQRALALKQFEICRSTLAKEFGISPMEETQTIYTQIFARDNENDFVRTSRQQIDLDQALRQLGEACQTIDLAKEQIQRALQFITRYSQHPD